MKADNLFLKKTLFESLKKLLRVVITTDDKSLQTQQLVRLYKWYTAKSDSLETKEGALAQKMKEDMLKKKREMKML